MNRLKLLGQEVRVYKNGVVWVNPDTKQRFLIGATRVEAEEELKRWRRERFGAFASCKVRSLPKLDDGTKAHRSYWRAFYSAKSRAKRANLPIVTQEEYARIISRANGRCEVSGIEFSAERPKGHRKAMWAPSLDQIVCGKGYSFENTRLVCVAVNLALNEFGVEVLAKIAHAIESRPLLPIPTHETPHCRP